MLKLITKPVASVVFLLKKNHTCAMTALREVMPTFHSWPAVDAVSMKSISTETQKRANTQFRQSERNSFRTNLHCVANLVLPSVLAKQSASSTMSCALTNLLLRGTSSVQWMHRKPSAIRDSAMPAGIARGSLGVRRGWRPNLGEEVGPYND